MKFTLNWLKEFLDTDADIEIIIENLTSLGLEVESVLDRRSEFFNFIVAEIKDAKPHPNAEKLQICEVFDGNDIHQVVCGAKNAKKGLKIIFALPGSIIPNGKIEIKKSKIRDIESNGMICSEEELLLSSGSDGIIELPDFIEVGGDFLSFYGLNDPVIELSVTPNRSDCLGVYGIARELSARGIGKLKEIKEPKIKESFKTEVTSEIRCDNSDCSYISFREIRNLKNIESPNWLKLYLKNIGLDPVSAIVDITNYINISFARPLHAYDRKKISGKFIVDYANKKQEIIALNSKIYHISNDDLLIFDENNIEAIAGVIGMDSSKCDEMTNNIVIESALFSPITVSKSGRKHNILSDSRFRFERGVDASFSKLGSDIAVQLITEICGGEISNLVFSGSIKTDKKIIDFPISKYKDHIGIDISRDIMINNLEKLGFEVKNYDHHLSVKVPSWRHDILIDRNISEEIARINGYDNIKSIKLGQFNEISIPNRLYNLSQRRNNDLKRIIASRGYYETVTWSFLASKNLEKFSSFNPQMKLLNPISSDLDYMRPTIIPNLIDAVKRNLSRSITNISLFELGPIFLDNTKTGEKKSLCAVITGNRPEKSYNNYSKESDIYELKSDIEFLFSELSFDFSRVTFDINSIPKYYHPKRSATIKLGKIILGYFGEIHPIIMKEYEIKQRVCAFEIFIDNIPISRSKNGKREELILSQFQPVDRDFAFIVSEEINIGDILSFISKSDKLIKDVNLFDIYRNDKLWENKKSVAISIKIQSNESTLTDQEIQSLSNKIISGVSEKFSAELRDK